nr:immunoglobulin light chain junction region [Macaca mulatta]
CQHYDSTPDSF